MMCFTATKRLVRLFKVLSLLILASLLSKSANAWLMPSSSHNRRYHHHHHDRCTLQFLANEKNNDRDENPSKEEEEEKSKRHMEMVRSLQMSFYADERKEGSSSSHPELDEETGILKNLPLWRVQWTELPGRSNVLYVHEPIYTNMFEKILNGPKPWLVGHLYLPDGSKNLKTEDPSLKLKTWEQQEDCSKNATLISSQRQLAVIVGCLMKISDYRRMADGRLLLLVQGTERFVVSNVKQELPYSIVDVQLVPDAEEIDPDLDWIHGRCEQDVSEARALAIRESINYQSYEYDNNHVLPVPDRADLQIADIVGTRIARVLPFSPFSKTLDPPSPMTTESNTKKTVMTTSADPDTCRTESGETLESRLLNSHILNEPPQHPETLRAERTTINNLSTDELEYELWLAINDYLVSSRTPVSPMLLGLVPPRKKWPSNFKLQQIGAGLSQLSDSIDHYYVAISPNYPDYRRQRRLSYSAFHLLESTEWGKDMRQVLLETPSTHARLQLVLERFYVLLNSNWGEFQ
jgi:hypothetical protein